MSLDGAEREVPARELQPVLRLPESRPAGGHQDPFPQGNPPYILSPSRTFHSLCWYFVFRLWPGSGYIKNEVLKVFIILDDKKITITNHIYHYDVILTQRDFDRVSHMYDNKTEEIRNEFENEMMSQIVVSLSTILHKISEKI